MRCLGEGLGGNASRNSSYTKTMSSASLKTLMVEEQKKKNNEVYSMLATC
jgi:hypothetical protein